MRRITLLVFFIGIVFAGMGQKVITGKVLDESNSFPVHGAILTARGITGIKQTDENGIFRMDVPDMVKTVVISCLGFVDKGVSVAGAEWLDTLREKPCFFNEALITQRHNRFVQWPGARLRPFNFNHEKI